MWIIFGTMVCFQSTRLRVTSASGYSTTVFLPTIPSIHRAALICDMRSQLICFDAAPQTRNTGLLVLDNRQCEYRAIRARGPNPAEEKGVSTLATMEVHHFRSEVPHFRRRLRMPFLTRKLI